MPVNKRTKEILTIIEDELDVNGFFRKKRAFDEKTVKLLEPGPSGWDCKNYLVILKRFNSFSPALPRDTDQEYNDIKGGGYFLNWQETGIAIDPGFNFLENLSKVQLSAGNINAILLTHGHNDHYIDIDPILTMIHKRNALKNNKLNGVAYYMEKMYEKALHYFKLGAELDSTDIICEKGIASSLYLLDIITEGININECNEAITEYWNRHRAISTDWPHGTPDKDKIDLILGRSGEKTITSITPLAMEQIRNIYFLNPGETVKPEGYKLEVEAVPAKHWDFYGKGHCVGTVFTLHDGNGSTFKVGMTSDTGYYFYLDSFNGRIARRELYQQFKECRVLVANIGSMLRNEFRWIRISDISNQSMKNHLYERHLGILGLVKLVQEIVEGRGSLELVIISEYGEEMIGCRTALTEILNKEECFNKEPFFLSGDIGLVLKLDEELKILVDSYHYFPASTYDKEERPADVKEKEIGMEIRYKS